DNKVDITYIDNAAQAHLDALEALNRPDNEPNPGGKAYFISNDDPVDLWPWINNLLKELGVSPIKKSLSHKAAYRAGAAMEKTWRTLRLGGEPPMTRFIASQLATSHWYDMEPARRDLGYKPEVSMEVGFQRLLESLKG
ncbi:MAG: 3-beta hydroxysteroid dehydrogenase, partial [Myxococcota bacterium]|nr:3-beta hydroxysteroid dehydrogenase [Myxococcota bacterium]